MLFLGALGVASMAYTAYRAKQKIAQWAREYGVANERGSGSETNAPARVFAPPKGSGCPLLDGQEAARILNVAIERVESTPAGADGAEECRYWVNAEERRRLAKSQIARGVGEVGKSDGKDGKDGFEKLVSGALSAAIEAAGDNKETDFALILQVYRSHGQAMWDKMEAAKGSAKGLGLDLGSLGVQPVEGVGDKSIALPGGHSIMVLKGDAMFMLGFQQFAPGRDKTTELAKVVAARL